MIRSLNIWLAASAVVALLLSTVFVPGSASAQEKKRVAVLEFTGTSASAFHAQVSGGLKGRPEVELVSPREVKGAASRLGNSLSSASDIKELGAALELTTVIEGTIIKKGRGLVATVRVRDASTGEVVHEETWNKRRSQMKTIKPTVWGLLAAGIRQTSAAGKGKTGKTKAKPVPVAAPEEDEEERAEERVVEQEAEAEEEEQAVEEAPRKRKKVAPEAPPESDDWAPQDDGEEAEEEAPKQRGKKSVQHPALVVLFGPRVMWRTLNYTGDTNLSSYTSSDQGSPAVNLALSGQWYPGAHKSNRWYSNLGLDLDSDYSMGLKSKLGTGKKVSTTAYEVGIGAIYRMQFGAFQPRVRVGYMKQVFNAHIPTELEAAPTNYHLPAVSYSAVRINLGANIEIVDWLLFDVSLGYLPVLGAGQLNEAKYGDKVSTSAWETGAGVLLRFKDVYGMRLAVDYRRYKYDFGLADNLSGLQLPKAGTDAYLRTTLSFVYTLPGQK